jgi:hypothetical protein
VKDVIIGAKDHFAVEFELDQEYGGPWLFGSFCYWIDGARVGDYELGTSLRDVLLQMRSVVTDCGNRSGGMLCDLPADTAFLVLDGLLYESEPVVTPRAFQMPDSPARFEVKIPVDVFDSWKIYLIECDNTARMIFRNTNDGRIEVARLAMGAFDTVISDAFNRLDSLYHQNAGPD